jgi:hypothetical protein
MRVLTRAESESTSFSPSPQNSDAVRLHPVEDGTLGRFAGGVGLLPTAGAQKPWQVRLAQPVEALVRFETRRATTHRLAGATDQRSAKSLVGMSLGRSWDATQALLLPWAPTDDSIC